MIHDTLSPAPTSTRAAEAAPREPRLPAQWDQLVVALDAALRAASPKGDWLKRVAEISMHTGALLRRKPDAALYYLIYIAGHQTERYGAHHSLLCAVVCTEAGRMLGWPRAKIDSLRMAALTMNVSMLALQDRLAEHSGPLAPQDRTEIDAHAPRSADMLEACRLGDRLCIDAVRGHHADPHPERALDDIDSAQRVSRLLRRVDIFAAKLSRRGTRLPMSPVQAAKHACLGPGDVPDEIGAALLKAVGLYPPGSLVKLHSGEIGIVIGRGARADMPKVAALLGPAGELLPEVVLRNTVMQRFAVRGAVGVDRITAQPSHDQLMRMIP